MLDETIQALDSVPTEPIANSEEAPVKDKKINIKFHQQIESCKQYRRSLVKDWQINVDYRRGKPFASQTDEDRVAVPLDWSLTKQKQAALFSQMTAVRVSHPPQTQAKEATPWVHAFETKLNDVGITAGVETVMEEVLPDCINAAGIGVCIVSREVISKDIEIPVTDLSIYPPELQQEITTTRMLPDGTPLQMEWVPQILDARYLAARVSPADFLWPLGFTGSDFDNSPWIGRSGRIPKAAAKRRFKLTDEELKKASGDDRSTLDRIDKISYETEKETATENEELVSFDELFYKTASYSAEATSFSQIHHLVFVNGKNEPVIDEPWQGQRLEGDQLVGCLKYPIRVLTLSYLTDDAIPPSDSAVGRPQVNELNKSRTQMILQRQHSLPVKWIDPNRVDPAVLYTLMRGTWQQYVPIVGGANAIGEVSRSAMPQENFTIDRIVKGDLSEAWQTGGLTTYGEDVETKAETQAIGVSVTTRVGKERARVGKFFVGIMESLGGLMSIYEDTQTFGEGYSPLFSKALSYSILADSTVLLDSDQRLKKLIQFINFTAKSGWVNLEPVLKEIASLSGLDPSQVITPPQPRPPAEPNISLRFTGTEDLLNPLIVATLIKSGQMPDEKLIERAKALIASSVTPPPNIPIGPDGQPMMPFAAPPGVGPQPEGVDSGLEPLPEPAPPGPGEANPQWGAMERLNKRTVERE